MKNYRGVIILLTCILIITAGCQQIKQPEASEPAVVQPQPSPSAEAILIAPVAGNTLETEGMTLLTEFSADLDMDNSEEKIELYTAAGRDENGEMVWDDGQNWILAVRDGEKAYPLLSQYVQLGSVYFTVSNKGADQIPNITVIVPTGASFSITGYSYDKEGDCYKGELLYRSADDNWLYSSIPGYR
ncbi:MAG: hypothetical protein ACM3ZR_12690 [Pseudomonadota bacterium]